MPVNKQQAAVFFVHPSVSVWALLVLRSEGWQLVRDAPPARAPPARAPAARPHAPHQHYHSHSCPPPTHPWQRSSKYSMEKRMEEEIFESEP